MSKYAVVAAFVIGVGIGAAGAWVYAKKKYEALVQEEIESIRESLGALRAKSEEAKKEKSETSHRDPEEIKAYAEFVHSIGYTVEKDVKETPKSDEPYVITPDEFYENEDYERLSFVLFSDGVLVDDDYMIVHNEGEVVGHDYVNHFGDYEEDAVYVRNDKFKTDYEVLRDQRTYEEYIEQNPHKAEA